MSTQPVPLCPKQDHPRVMVYTGVTCEARKQDYMWPLMATQLVQPILTIMFEMYLCITLDIT